MFSPRSAELAILKVDKFVVKMIDINKMLGFGEFERNL